MEDVLGGVYVQQIEVFVPIKLYFIFIFVGMGTQYQLSSMTHLQKLI